ncbi:MAG: single-stranded DNA binding protein [Inoviridae sp.]|nr:MAG: single-stranded DNA binding protein [Inoviridae sp.]
MSQIHKVKIYVTGEPARSFVAKSGKTHSISNIFVHLGNAPFPVEIGAFEVPNLPKGTYEVPFYLESYQNRLNVRFDWTNAFLLKD